MRHPTALDLGTFTVHFVASGARAGRGTTLCRLSFTCASSGWTTDAKRIRLFGRARSCPACLRLAAAR